MNNNSGTLKISSEADRVSVATILFKNGYAVTPRRVKNGKRTEIYIDYSRPGETAAESDITLSISTYAEI